MLLYTGHVRLETERRAATVGTSRIELTAKEFLIMAELMKSKGAAVGYGELAERSRSSEAAVKAHVCSIRKKIGAWCVESVYGFGYVVPDVPFFVTVGRE